MAKKDSHFILSPFPAVTQYENAFIKAWNENTAMAVAEMLKYIAAATASAIKSGDVSFVSEDIQKSEKVEVLPVEHSNQKRKSRMRK